LINSTCYIKEIFEECNSAVLLAVQAGAEEWDGAEVEEI
jgi:hypothetical protein